MKSIIIKKYEVEFLAYRLIKPILPNWHPLFILTLKLLLIVVQKLLSWCWFSTRQVLFRRVEIAFKLDVRFCVLAERLIFHNCMLNVVAWATNFTKRALNQYPLDNFGHEVLTTKSRLYRWWSNCKLECL